MCKAGLGKDVEGRSVGGATRNYNYLGTLTHMSRFDVTCETTSAGTEEIQVLDKTFRVQKIEEICRNETKAFKNVKWVSASGKTRKATQWVGHEVGFIIIEWLN